MKILEHDELSSDLEADLQHLRASIGLPPRGFELLEEARRAGYPAPDYFGLYAVEGRHVLSTIRLLRLPYTFPDGHTEPVSSIMSVMTRADSRGRGLVKGLLQEIHKREREAGIGYSILWCELSIKAHGLYEYMGYKDVYFLDFATKRPLARASKGKYRLVQAKAADLGKIGRIHAEVNRDRIGFTARPRGYLESLVKYGNLSPDAFRLVVRDGRTVGYLRLEDGPTAVKVPEVVTLPASVDTSELVSTLEGLCGERWLWLEYTFVRDSGKVLARRGFDVSGGNNHVIMATPLDGSAPKDMVTKLGTSDPRFVCHASDFF